VKRLSLAAAVLLLAGCAAPTPPPEPPPPPTMAVEDETPLAVQRDVRAGAFCSPPEAPGITKTGVKVRCTTTAKDDTHRWRRESK
jgi:hypothetical protein